MTNTQSDNKIYYSIRVVSAPDYESAKVAVENNDFDESHDICDKILTREELLHEFGVLDALTEAVNVLNIHYPDSDAELAVEEFDSAIASINNAINPNT